MLDSINIECDQCEEKNRPQKCSRLENESINSHVEREKNSIIFKD